MTQVDWQAYEDGSLSAADRAEAERILAGSEEARKEVEGLRAFRAELKKQALSEDVPMAALEQSLGALKSRPASRARTWGSLTALAAAACIILFIFMHDPMRIDTLPTRAKFSTSSLALAGAWVENTSGIDAPIPDATSVAPLTMARHGDGWACYDYVKDGESYFIYVRKRSNAFEGSETQQVNGQLFFVGKGIGWQHGSWAYYVRGGSESVRWELAKAAAESTRPSASRI